MIRDLLLEVAVLFLKFFVSERRLLKVCRDLR